jgi:hypothetical protein
MFRNHMPKHKEETPHLARYSRHPLPKGEGCVSDRVQGALECGSLLRFSPPEACFRQYGNPIRGDLPSGSGLSKLEPQKRQQAAALQSP